jgi:cyclophilin family peptidyl-prolyl cis-trans isomerase
MLVKQRDEIVARLQALQPELRAAKPEERPALQKEFEGLVMRLRQEVLPRLRKAAVGVLAQPVLDDETADEIGGLAFTAFQENKFKEAAQLADGLLEKKAAHPGALNVSGVAHFALQDFERAVAVLDKAKEADVLDPRLGGNYHPFAQSYGKHWQQEQTLRAKEAAAQGDQQLPRVQLNTSRGNVTLELFENEAPNAVANFINLVEKKFYDGTKFHRVIPTFMAQGGDPNTKPGAVGQPGTGGPGYTIKCECYAPNKRRHFSGSLSMAHAGKDTGGSQFFITHLPTPHLDGESQPPSFHTVFGRVVEGMDVVLAMLPGDQIESATVLRKRNHEYKPVTQPDKE